MNKNIEIIGGGTVFHVRNNFSISETSYGKTAKDLFARISNVVIYNQKDYNVNLTLTSMASGGQSKIETNKDVSDWVNNIISNGDTKIVFFNASLVDYEGSVIEFESSYRDLDSSFAYFTDSGKYRDRLKSSDGDTVLNLKPSEKIISRIKKTRKDIFLVGFKSTFGLTEDEQFISGLNLLINSNCNLVFVHDTKTNKHMIVTPERVRYAVSTSEIYTIKELVDMALARSELLYDDYTLINNNSISWSSDEIPTSFKKVVNYCISKGAFKPINGFTDGHFSIKIDDSSFLTSKDNVNFNNLSQLELVKVVLNNGKTMSYGGSPASKGTTQKIIFNDHEDIDCIIHLHVKTNKNVLLTNKKQKYFESGTYESAKNISDGLKEEFNGIKCVELENHGQFIAFNKKLDPNKVIAFIEKAFNFNKSTDGIDRNNLFVV